MYAWLAAVVIATGCGRYGFEHHDARGASDDVAIDAPPVFCGGVECQLPHAVATCVGNACAVSACVDGYADCNTKPADGCEISIATDPANCGVCGATCASGVCGNRIDAAFTTQPADWTFNGTASYDPASQVGVLTPAVGPATGSIIYRRALVTGDFDVAFDFEIVAGSSGSGDGMGFMLETDGATAIGNDYAGLGIAALHGYGVELDTYNNNACGDTSNNHVGIDELPSCGTGGAPISLTAANAPVTMRGTGFHTCAIHEAAGTISVAIDGVTAIDSFTPTGFTTGTSYFFGFGGGNGGNYDLHAIRNVSIVFPRAQCL